MPGVLWPAEPCHRATNAGIVEPGYPFSSVLSVYVLRLR
jgi:hypothetical protein